MQSSAASFKGYQAVIFDLDGTLLGLPAAKRRELLGGLAASGVKIGIASNRDQRSADMFAELLAEEAGVEFQAAVGVIPGLVEAKPAPDILLAACCQLELPADNQVLYVGDMPLDAAAATAAGCAFAFVNQVVTLA